MLVKGATGDLVLQTFQVQNLRSAEEDNLSPFKSKIACLCQSNKINNNKNTYITLAGFPMWLLE